MSFKDKYKSDMNTYVALVTDWLKSDHKMDDIQKIVEKIKNKLTQVIQDSLSDPVAERYYMTQLGICVLFYVMFVALSISTLVFHYGMTIRMLFPHYLTLHWLLLCGVMAYVTLRIYREYHKKIITKDKLVANGERGDDEWANDTIKELSSDVDKLNTHEGLAIVPIHFKSETELIDEKNCLGNMITLEEDNEIDLIKRQTQYQSEFNSEENTILKQLKKQDVDSVTKEVNKSQKELKRLHHRKTTIDGEIELRQLESKSRFLLNDKRGIVLHTDETKENFYVCHETIHNLVLGPTGAGKSQTVVFPQMEILSRKPHPTVEQLKVNGATKKEINKALNCQESMIINDVKGELLQNTRSFLVERGYKVKVINLETPYYSDCYNPFEAIKIEYLKALENAKEFNQDTLDLSEVTNLANSIALTLHDDPNAKDKIWSTTAQDLTSATILAMVEDLIFEENQKFPTTDIETSSSFNPYTMTNAIATFSSTTSIENPQEKKFIFDYFTSREVGNIGRLKANAILSADSKSFGNFISNTSTGLSMFTDESIARLTSMHDIDYKELIDEPTAIFLVCPDDNPTRWGLASIFVEQSYFMLSKMIKSDYNGKSPRRINYILDEFAQMPVISHFHTKTSMARSRNIRFSCYVQDLQQISVKYGDLDKIIKNNLQNFIYIKTQDMESAKSVSERLGNRTVVRKSVSSGVGERDYNISESLEEEPLMRVSELVKMPFEKGIVLRLGRAPIKSDFHAAFRYFSYKSTVSIQEQKENGEKINKDVPIIKQGIEETSLSACKERGTHASIDLKKQLKYCDINLVGEKIPYRWFESARKNNEINEEMKSEVGELSKCEISPPQQEMNEEPSLSSKESVIHELKALQLGGGIERYFEDMSDTMIETLSHMINDITNENRECKIQEISDYILAESISEN